MDLFTPASNRSNVEARGYDHVVFCLDLVFSKLVSGSNTVFSVNVHLPSQAGMNLHSIKDEI